MSDDSGKASPQVMRDEARSVVARLRDAGHIAYFAGGCVRDTLLGDSPKDFDIATDAPPAKVRQLFPRTQAVGAAFGVILVRQKQSVVEVATFRADGVYHDGRHPSEVKFTTAEEDAKRRDFTINGLFLDPLDGDRIIDFVGGLDDLHAKVIRAIGDPVARFTEDHLRILRAIRFAARLDFGIEPKTLTAIKMLTPNLVRISPERVADELRRTLTPPSRARAWPLLREKIMDLVFRFHERDLSVGESNLFASVEPAGQISVALALSAAWLDRELSRDWVDEIPSPKQINEMVRALRQSLRLSNEESDAMAGILLPISQFLAIEVPRVAVLKRFLAKSTANETRSILRAMGNVGLIEPERIRSLESTFDQLVVDGNITPPPLLTGDDLTAAGYSPGPHFKRALDAAYDAQLEGRVPDKLTAMALAEQFLVVNRQPEK